MCCVGPPCNHIHLLPEQVQCPVLDGTHQSLQPPGQPLPCLIPAHTVGVSEHTKRGSQWMCGVAFNTKSTNEVGDVEGVDSLDCCRFLLCHRGRARDRMCCNTLGGISPYTRFTSQDAVRTPLPLPLLLLLPLSLLSAAADAI